ncbi:HU family DNA-binding protein [Porphyromonas levii]|uniref:HU family DNA-binding protein n=1 Tax=Porphyromonas levii TaxID=28114 RepID=A0A4Y8WS23_9PORP|nr:HU family DNA-binding protein [Porphyromonas levii]MBR8703671.1 DNA-binding protein HU [Porphyromonas levii]MBR8713550.1 DNA-binding protein HU [Porphyromonas levii]MBR8715582.1 DNA-binding protein HU [Porphyromonas levii]MBR8728107.1 DNA-binding protein HU [Porphyromonas levii]MBR8729484.1 DNA-binding protein HU [Porphyromonas levii]
MNKTEFIAAIAEKGELTKVDAKKAVDAGIEVIREEMLKGEKIAILGFGTFSVSERAAREGVNPQTGKKMKIAARKVVRFKAGAALNLNK